MDIKEMKPAHLSRSRIIPSRYKKAATELTQKSTASLSSSGSHSRVSFENSGTRIKSSQNVEQINAAGASVANLAHMGRMNKTPSRFPNRKKSNELNSKLHSTALNNTTFLEKTNIAFSEDFSTTVVGQKGFHPTSIASLSELPDISHISSKLSNESEESKSTVFSAFSQEENEILEDEERDFPLEEINVEYLKYLTHALVDMKNNASFEKQMKEGKKQISFLAHLIQEEEQNLAKEKMKLELLDHYNGVAHNYEILKEKLKDLDEIAPPSTKALTELTRHLEDGLNRIKLENIYKPANTTSHGEHFQDAVQQNCYLLDHISGSLETRINRLQSLSLLANDLTEEVDDLDECLSKEEKAASLRIQESSLKLTLDNPNESSKP